MQERFKVDLRPRPGGRARAAAAPHPRTRAGRRQPDDILVSAMSALRRDRPQGRGPDRPRQHARVVRRGARPRRGHDRVRRAARVRTSRTTAACCSRTTTSTSTGAPTLEEGLAHLASRAVRGRRARRRPQAPRLRGARRRGAARARAGRAHADLDDWMRSLVVLRAAGAEAAARLVGPAPAQATRRSIVADQAARLRRAPPTCAAKLPVRGQGAHGRRAAATR